MIEIGLEAQGRNQWLESRANAIVEGLSSAERTRLAELYLRRFDPHIAQKGRSHGVEYLAKSEVIVRLRYGLQK